MLMIKPLKERRCAVCRELYTPKRIGLKITKVCLNAACVLDWAQGIKAKEFKKQASDAKREFNRRDIKWQHKQCQPVFNTLRRLQEFKWFKDRGIEPYCISCGNTLGGDEWACGHFRSVGSNSALRYDPVNTYLQHNRRCNQALSGDINGTSTTKGYKQGLIDRFGADLALWITDYCEIHNDPVKWDWQKMEAMRKEWNAEIRQLKKELEIN